jgi:hypothetical protein
MFSTIKGEIFGGEDPKVFHVVSEGYSRIGGEVWIRRRGG